MKKSIKYIKEWIICNVKKWLICFWLHNKWRCYPDVGGKGLKGVWHCTKCTPCGPF
ncbi:hypothetical protein LCGC14_2179170 [marine sediment metagenome]|uniref:Uncharacterized protein n=1 Tax=marine sediment metagenome TaxID=412755 RepID=A0A0F9DMT8_9ZZZZ